MKYKDFLKIAKREENDNLVFVNFEREADVAALLPERQAVLDDFKNFLENEYVSVSGRADTTSVILDDFISSKITRGSFKDHPGLLGNSATSYFKDKCTVALKSLFDFDGSHKVLSVMMPSRTKTDLQNLADRLAHSVLLEVKLAGYLAGGAIPSAALKQKINSKLSSHLDGLASNVLSFDKDLRVEPTSGGSRRKKRKKVEVPNDIWWVSCLEDTENWIVPDEAANGHLSLFRAFLGLSSSRDRDADSSVLFSVEPEKPTMGRMYVHFAIDEKSSAIPKTQPNPFSEGFPELWLGAGTGGGRTVQLVDTSCSEDPTHTACNCAAACLPEAVVSYRDLKETPRKTHKIAVAFMFTDDLGRFVVPDTAAIRSKADQVA